VTELAYRPLTAELWPDLERLFGPERGAMAGCWCMWFRLRRRDWDVLGRSGRKAAFRRVVEEGPPPGLLAYAGSEPVAWVAVGPRDRYPAVERSRVVGPVDDRPAHAITCFYVAAPWRRRGLTRPLIDAAVAFARGQGASLVEAYPLDPAPGKRMAWDGYHGFAAAFRDRGFVEVARRSPQRPIMRLELG
jgi:GNAT superfamily N-acetyltransferase